MLEVACPTCGAAIGVRCRRPSEHRVFGGEPHPERDRAADRTGHYGPCPRGECGLANVERRRQQALFEQREQDRQRDRAELARRRAAAPLKPAKPQEPCDVGLFSDARNQLDLVDQARRP